jgi:hypothetical protein
VVVGGCAAAFEVNACDELFVPPGAKWCQHLPVKVMMQVDSVSLDSIGTNDDGSCCGTSYHGTELLWSCTVSNNQQSESCSSLKGLKVDVVQSSPSPMRPLSGIIVVVFIFFKGVR